MSRVFFTFLDAIAASMKGSCRCPSRQVDVNKYCTCCVPMGRRNNFYCRELFLVGLIRDA